MTIESTTTAYPATPPNRREQKRFWRPQHLASTLPIAIVVAAGLAPITWFHSGLPIKGVDSYFSLHPVGRLTTSLEAWDSRTSSGVPVSDVIAVGLNSVQAGLALLGLPLFLGELVIIVTLSSAAAVGMYCFGLLILKGHVALSSQRYIAAVMTICWLANPFALSFVWSHQLLIEVTWAALPWLLFILFSGLAKQFDIATMVCTMLIVLVVGSAGFPHAYLPGIGLLLGVFGLAAVAWTGPSWAVSARLSILALTILVGVAWWLLPSLPMVTALVGAATIGPDSPRAQLEYASQFSSIRNVVTLTAVPILHQTVDKTPYLSWSFLVLDRPGTLLILVLPAVAAVGLIYAVKEPRARPLAVASLTCIALATFLSKGLSPPLSELNLALMSLPLGDALRHPLDKFSFVLVLPICVLFGMGLAWLVRSRFTTPLAVLAALIVGGYLAAPWWLADVIPVGGGRLPSAFVQVPRSYETIGGDLSRGSTLGKTMVLPYSPDGGSAFAWKSGVQPNLDCLLQDWAPNRTVMCHDSGDVLADRVPATLWRAVAARDTRVFKLAYAWGIDSWLVHRDWDLSYFVPAVNPDNAIAFLTQRRAESVPLSPVTRSNQAVPLSSSLHPLKFSVRANSAPPDSERLLQIGSIAVQVNRASSSDSVYIGLRDQLNNLWYPGDGAVFPVGTWHTVTLRFDGTRLYFAVDGVDQGSLSACDAVGCHAISGHGLPLSPFPKTFQLIASSGLMRVDITMPKEVLGIAERRFANSYTRLVDATPELELFWQPSLPAVYSAKSVELRDHLDSQDALLQVAQESAALRDPVWLSTSSGVHVVDPNSQVESWVSDSSTHLHGTLNTVGPAALVFLQTFDSHWTLMVNGERVPDSKHFVANGFANAWLVQGAGHLIWTIDYGLQRAVTLGVGVGAALLFVAIALPIVRMGLRLTRLRHKPAAAKPHA
jgi:hypothetical protein